MKIQRFIPILLQNFSNIYDLKIFFLFREELIALMKEMKEQIPLKKAEISGTYKHRFHNDYNLEIHLCLFLIFLFYALVT